MDAVIRPYKRADGLWDWRLVEKMGRVVATSGGQGYTERNDATEAAARVFEDMYPIEIDTE